MWILSLWLNLYTLLATGKQSTPLIEVASITDGPTLCRKSRVAVLGAGVAGITAAQTISAQSIDDFIIIEYNDSIGGRCRQSKFGKDKNGIPYTVEIGANWIQGTGFHGGVENPIMTLAKKYEVENHPSNVSSLATYDERGQVDFVDKLLHFDNTYSSVQEILAESKHEEIPDGDLRSAFELAGYNSYGDPQSQAVEWYRMDYEYAHSPDLSSREFTIANHKSTFATFGQESNFVFDQRGFNTFIHNQAAEFLEPNDKRLLLNKVVEKISWDGNSTTTYMTDGSCIEADYIINTFSLGVLRSGDVTFSPPLPQWKQDAINAFQFGTFTKIFLQFPPEKVFWDRSTEFFLYASPITRGHYPVWQSLDHPSFLPGSGILMTTVVAEQAYAVENQDDETTKEQVLKVLREMFGENSVPEPIDFMYPRWSSIPWSYGSFSNWPPGMTISEHENLKANTGRMVFAGEATSTKYYGYLHGAYFEGKAAGDDVAACIKNLHDPSCQIQTTRRNIISSNF